jgi:hypothetical protein
MVQAWTRQSKNQSLPPMIAPACTLRPAPFSFFGKQNVTYYVRVHSFNSEKGDFSLSVEESKIEASGINDFCSDSNPTFLVGGAMVNGSLDGAQNYPTQSCAARITGNVGLWCK